MEKGTIEWKGKEYPTRTLKLSEKTANEYDEHDEVVVSVISLWDAMEEEYFNKDNEAEDIDDGIFYYVEDAFMEKNPSEKELQRYLEENL